MKYASGRMESIIENGDAGDYQQIHFPPFFHNVFKGFFVFPMSLSLSQATNFELKEFKFDENGKKLYDKGRKHCEKR